MAERTTESGLARLRGRRAWTEDEARRVVAAWKASGEAVPAFAHRTGLGVDRVYRWRRRLGGAPGESDAIVARQEPSIGPALVPVVIRASSSRLASEGSAKVTVCTREGHRVEVAALDAASAAWVAMLMKSLGAEQEVGS